MVENKSIGIAVFLISSIIIGQYVLTLTKQSDPLTPAIGSFKGMCDLIEYTEIAEYFDFEVKYPNDLGLPDQVWVKKSRDFTFLVYKNSEISNEELDILVSLRDSHVSIIDAGGIVLEVFKNNMDIATILSSVNDKVDADPKVYTIIYVDGNVGYMAVSESVTLIRWYSKTSVYYLGARAYVLWNALIGSILSNHQKKHKNQINKNPNFSSEFPFLVCHFPKYHVTCHTRIRLAYE